MVNIVYAAPYAAPTSPGLLASWKGMRHTWTGWDGSEWDLTDPSGGVAFTADGLEGLGMPDITNYTHDSPVVHGASWDGWLATGRKVFWPVAVFSGSATDSVPSSQAWIRRNRAFWKTFRPGKVGTWTVELPSGEKFSLKLRFDGAPDWALTHDPAQKGWAVYGIELFPEQPFWEAPAIVESWATGEQVPFLGPEGEAPPFFVSPAATLGTATLTNPGDVETFIRWTVRGPARSAQVGIDGVFTVLPVNVPDGSKLVVDTNPRNLIAELDGVDVMEQLGELNYEPLQPGESVELSLELDGTGSIEAAFTPLMFMGV